MIRIRKMIRNTWTVPLAAMLLGGIVAPATYAYGEATHYAFTYYLCRATGYTAEQAYRIASADVSVDYDPNTDARVPPDYLRFTDERAQRQRVLFHAMLDEVAYPNCLWRGHAAELAQAMQALRTRRSEFRSSSEDLGNVGPYLHFLQDYYGHAGYGSKMGHFKLTDPTQDRINGVLPWGGATDLLSYIPDAGGLAALSNIGYERMDRRNGDMTSATIQTLRSYLQSHNPAQYAAASIYRDQIEAVRQRIAEAEAEGMNLGEIVGVVEDFMTRENWTNVSFPEEPRRYRYVVGTSGPNQHDIVGCRYAGHVRALG